MSDREQYTPGPANGAQVQKSGDNWTLVLVRELRHSPQKVWAALTEPAHLRVLRDAGFVESTVDAQRRLYRLKPEPLREMDAWLAQFRRFWSAHVDALERHLDRMDLSARTKKKTRRRR